MFEQAILSTDNSSRRAWTAGLGFLGEAALVATVALVPILWPQAMPKPQALLMLLTPPAPIAPAHVATVKPRASQTAVARPYLDPMRIPTIIPKGVPRIVDDGPPPLPGAVPGTDVSGGNSDLIGGLLTRASTPPRPPAATPTEPAPKPDSTEPKRVRVSSLQLGRVIRQVEPVYPPIAKLAHVSGTVELTAVVGTDGHIRELKAIGGNPLLLKAAIDAVSQWVYSPPILNGERIEVIAPITVNFRLDR